MVKKNREIQKQMEKKTLIKPLQVETKWKLKSIAVAGRFEM